MHLLAKDCVIIFSSGPCKGAAHFAQVIENWEGDGHLPNQGGEDQDLSRKRKKQEDHWMLKLRTIYPYGLNESLNEPRFCWFKLSSIT